MRRIWLALWWTDALQVQGSFEAVKDRLERVVRFDKIVDGLHDRLHDGLENILQYGLRWLGRWLLNCWRRRLAAVQLIGWCVEGFRLNCKCVFDVVVVVVVVVGVRRVAVVVAQSRVPGRRLHAVVRARRIAHLVRLGSLDIASINRK